MPFSGNKWDDSKLVPYRAALRAVVARHPELQPARPRPHDTARVTSYLLINYLAKPSQAVAFPSPSLLSARAQLGRGLSYESRNECKVGISDLTDQ